MDVITAQAGAIVAGTLGCLIQTTFDLVYSLVKKKTYKLAPVLMASQAFLCALRALTLVLQTIVPGINCKLLGNIGMTIYALWITALDATLLLRSNAFFTSQGIRKTLFLSVCSLQIALSLAVQIYVASSAFTINTPGEVCIVLADFSIQTVTLVNRCILYGILLIPFVGKALEVFKSPEAESATHWIRLCINNIFFALLIIVTEIVAATVSLLPSLIPWLEAFFACVNYIECMTLLQIIEDTKEKLTSNSKDRPTAGTNNMSVSVALKTTRPKLDQSGEIL